MKNLLTIVVIRYSEGLSSSPLHDGIELLYPQENETETAFTSRAIKDAKGKYVLLLRQKFKLDDINPFLNALDKNSSDMIQFEGGIVIKTSIAKGVVKRCPDLFSCYILSILDCKSILKSNYCPFIFEKREVVFTEANYNGLLVAARAFIAVKAKLTKDMYTLTMNALCKRLVIFYIVAMIGIKEGKINSEPLISFDSQLKGEIVLYLALEKNFTAAKLTKLRKKGFKISYFTAIKFKKILKAQ